MAACYTVELETSMWQCIILDSGCYGRHVEHTFYSAIS